MFHEVDTVSHLQTAPYIVLMFFSLMPPNGEQLVGTAIFNGPLRQFIEKTVNL